MDYRAADDAALYNALVNLKVYPNRGCGRADLRPVAFCEDVWGCAQCRETWFLGEDAPLPSLQGPSSKCDTCGGSGMDEDGGDPPRIVACFKCEGSGIAN